MIESYHSYQWTPSSIRIRSRHGDYDYCHPDIQHYRGCGWQTNRECPRGTVSEANKAIDGDTFTRWSSDYTDDEWLQVELPNPARVDKAVLIWEVAYCKAYEIQVSKDGMTWRT